jgi:hypothetical protein
VEVNIDWELAPAGESTGAVTVRGANEQVVVRVPISKPAEPAQDTIHGYVDAAGYVSIDPTRAACVNNAGEKQWYLLEDYGRTRSAMRAQGPADCTALPGQDSPQLHYPIHLLRSGEVQVTALLGPTFNFLSGRPLRYAVSFDDDTPHVATVVPADYKVTNSNRARAKTVGDNAHESTSSHKIAKPGHHTLKIWMIDPGVVVQKILIDTGGLRPSYLGPPETFRR